jgi:hypothetical protein
MAASASSDRIGQIEHGLERLGAKVDALGADLRVELHTSIKTSEEETRRLIREGDEETRRQMREGGEETRRQMRLLHEEVIGRIALLGESRPPEAPSRPRRRPKP